MTTTASSRPRVIPREKSLIIPDVQNPFVHRLKLCWLDKLQIAVMSVTVFPLRLILITIFLMMAWAVARIALIGHHTDQKEPLSGWRRRLYPVVAGLGRLMFMGAGFHWIRWKGRRAMPSEAPILCYAPHTTFFDAISPFATALSLFPSAISRVENDQIPFLGTLTRFTQPVFVSREDPNSRVNTIKEIKRRAHSGGKWPQIIIFPEGTCTNRTCLIAFKPGAFYPGVPVQPVCVRYTNKLDTFTWTWDGPGAFTLFWLTLCQINNQMEIEFLPVYTPKKKKVPTATLR